MTAGQRTTRFIVAVAVTVAVLTLGAVTITTQGFGVFARGTIELPATDLGSAADYHADYPAGTESAATLGGAALDSAPTPVATPSYDLSAHQTLSRVIILLKENYVEPERIKPYDMFIAALDYIQKTIPEVIVDDSEAPRRIKVAVMNNEHVFDLERLGGLDQLWEVTLALRDIFRFIQTYITDPEQRHDIEYAAINGMLSTLDPHSVLLKPESFNEMRLSTRGEFGGLGIVISIRDGGLTVVSPIEDTPAARAGIKAQDQIVKIGEESTVNMGLEEAVERLRGKPGSKINIWVKRKKWTEPKRFVLTRAVIKIQSVASRLLDRGVGYVRIKNFQANTFDDLHAHLEGLRKKNKGELKGLVLDLRNNPGGLLDQAILVSDRFIDRGPLVITVGEGNRKRDVKSAHAQGTEPPYPMAVLVNSGSASASEIVAGALKNHDRAVIVGQQTFGKGSVQVLYDFKDKSALKLTIAQYLTPGDVSIQGLGISPDVAVQQASIEGHDVHVFVSDDATREKDLEHHLEVPQVVRESEDLVVEGAKSATASQPSVTIVHLAEAAANEGEPKTQGDDEQEGPNEFVYDFETQLAHDLVANAKSSDRKKIIAESRTVFLGRADEQEQKVAKRLEGLGVDWAAAKDAEKGGRAEATVDLAMTPQTTTRPLTAGDTVTFTATVRNTGSSPLYRVYGITQSENPLFKNLEFAFGRLAPGASKSWTTEVKLPREMSARADDMTISIGDQQRRLDAVKTGLVVSIEEQKKPRFAYSMWLDDRSGGNGDGVLQVGEKVNLIVDVKNIGTGQSDEAVVSLKNLSGDALFLERGRDKVEALKPGKNKSVELKFSLRVDPNSRDGKRPDLRAHPEDGARDEDGNVDEAPKAGDAIDLKVSVWDSTYGETVSEHLHVPVREPRKARAENRPLLLAGNDEVPIFAGADATMPVVAYAKSGAAMRSDASFDGWYRVEVGNGAPGYIRDSDIKLGAKAASARKATVRTIMAHSVPSIELDVQALVTPQPSMRLSGFVRDEQALKDVFVFVNDKKVFYGGLKEMQADKGVYRAPFDVTVSLRTGSNTVAVVARESNDLVTRKIFGVYRSDPALASVREPSTSKR
ncbi:MAG: MXAN_5808 family serine peptidase [Myxococcota bacterium]